MNALSILSGLGTGTPSPPRTRTSSLANLQLLNRETSGDGGLPDAESDSKSLKDADDADSQSSGDDKPHSSTTANSPPFDATEQTRSRARKVPRRIADAFIGSLRWLLAIMVAPGYYIASCFFDDLGTLSVLEPLTRLYHFLWRRKRRKMALHKEEETDSSHVPSRDASSSSHGHEQTSQNHPSHNTRSKSAARDSSVPGKRSIKIKLHSEVARNRARRASDVSQNEDDDPVARVATALKSPPSGSTFATKLRYPRAPLPPRPLVPRRQPSFTTTTYSTSTPKKTLIIDLDETLIHSMAKGGRMSTGHMVEVKIAASISGNGVTLGPQVPILYYVHERPYCHEFLRKVCKWYNLIVFTASVQEYADPVIDWLERERAYFSGRYYRQHCTYRNGAYIKDLSHVEPDLSKVMILDNSPMSYIFHEDNAVPIEGWISDPTDHDLLHLVPLFEGLQYVTDVRALLALRLGQADKT